MMPFSKIISPIHFVITTLHRKPLVTPEIERQINDVLFTQARRLDCEVLAIGCMPDHVHIAVLFPASITYAECIERFKAATTPLLQQLHGMPDDCFCWQRGYGVFGFGRDHIPTVINYINNQKQHHIDNKLWPALELLEEGVTSADFP